LVRKVSTVCLLNDPSEFEGGEFELEGDRVFKMKQGSVISFPSFLRHRVKPVTSGNRMSAVCWILGDKVL
jgi:PKHD-type hydroxylase